MGEIHHHPKYLYLVLKSSFSKSSATFICFKDSLEVVFILQFFKVVKILLPLLAQRLRFFLQGNGFLPFLIP